MQSAGIPCENSTINEMISLMDMDKDGRIGWDEFELFLMQVKQVGSKDSSCGSSIWVCRFQYALGCEPTV